ncbi:MAG: histidine triad nucleotide-binding protein [Chloroflexi bacterium]|nr:histidine triad nucleotide-binding protein [Chloroflexota bacterium]
MEEDIFCQIVARKIPADIVFQDDQVTAFRDINPQAPVHIVVVPNRHIPDVSDLTPADAPLLGRLFAVANELARREGIASSGYRLVINHGRDAGQSVAHLHLHLLGGRAMAWPPG